MSSMLDGDHLPKSYFEWQRRRQEHWKIMENWNEMLVEIEKEGKVKLSPLTLTLFPLA